MAGSSARTWLEGLNFEARQNVWHKTAIYSGLPLIKCVCLLRQRRVELVNFAIPALQYDARGVQEPGEYGFRP